MKKLTNLIILSVIALAMTTEFSYGCCFGRRTKKRKFDISADLNTIKISEPAQKQEAEQIQEQVPKRRMLRKTIPTQQKNPDQLLQERGQLYGNKTANLMRLKSLEGIISPGYQVKVPPFYGITNTEVVQYLDAYFQRTKGLQASFEAEWKQLLLSALYQSDRYKEMTPDQVHQDILTNKEFPEQFNKASKAFGKKIKQIFTENQFISTELSSFINEAHGSPLMVRSTGKEDTAEFANAGGNETVANVDPTIQEISAAMGMVVASYIGFKSLNQRLAVATNSEDITQILETPFVPVLIQCMIGEPVGGITLADEQDLQKLPVSGVLFTTEAEGKTPGVSHLQASFGHNEGVVNNGVLVDTWYMTSDERFYPIIRDKTQRVIPNGNGELIPIQNTYKDGTHFGKQAALPSSAVLAIKKLADRIQEHYRKPMDVELVVMPDKKTIYLVQARPIVFGQKNPSYFSDDFVKKCEMLQGVKFGIGAGTACEIHPAADLLINNNLESAIIKYIGMQKQDCNQIKCIIIKEMATATATSHVATTLRAANKSIIQFDDHDLLKKWLKDSAEPALHYMVDIQRGCLLRTRQNLPDESIVRGWRESPLPLQLSVNPARGVSLPQVLQTRKSAISAEDQKLWNEKTIQDLFEILKTSTRETTAQAYMSLISIIDKLDSTLNQKKIVQNPSIAVAIRSQAYLIAEGIVQTLPRVEQPRSLELLFHINFLQALFDQPNDPCIIDQHSLAQLAKKAQLAEKAQLTKMAQ